MVGSRFAHRNWGLLSLIGGVAGALLAGFAAGPVHAAPQPPPAAAGAPSWPDVERLASEQKYEAAAAEVAQLRELARRVGDDPGWAKALIREVRLRMGLHGYETAVRFLQDQPWPRDRLARAALLLFQAQTYVAYDQEYDWEIGQRERVAAARPGDLKTWTRDQLFSAAIAAYVELWKSRDALGAEPIARLADYLDANTYPPEVRGTLRDALSYLFIELLDNTRGWSPAQSEDVFELDLAALLKGDVARGRGVNLADPGVHPLVRVAAVLDDLEAWHTGRHERDAALETQLTRAKLLFAHFTEEADRERIATDLEGRLSAFKAQPWWAMGNGALAQLEEQEGHRAHAHTLAIAGALAYPRSVGGQLCRSIAARLELPSFQLAAMEADGLHQRSLLVTHANLPQVTLRAYPIDLERRLLDGQALSDVPEGPALRKLLATSPVKEWTVPLPATPDFKPHQTYVTPPLDALGAYLIVGSARSDFGAGKNLIAGLVFTATELVMLRRVVGSGGEEVQVLDGASGAPVANATVSQYRSSDDSRHRTVVATRQTDTEGVATFTFPRNRGGSYLFVARHGASVVAHDFGGAAWRSPESDETRAFVYTDRSIYRPGQKLSFKVIVFAGNASAARYRVVGGHAVTVSLRDPNGDEVDKRVVKTNAYGSVAGTFAIPAGRLLGQWSITTSAPGEAFVRVEEYKRPTFEVKVFDPPAALRLNASAAFAGEARYFFGLPVTAGQVRWRVTREPVYPDWWGWSWNRPSAATQTVATGTAMLDGEGKFRLAFTPRADERDAARGGGRDVSYRYRVTADVTEAGGETRSADRAFRLGFVSVEATLELGAGFVRAATAATIKATRANLDGAPRPGNATWRLMALTQPNAPVLPADRAPARPGATDEVQTPGDRLEPRWAADAPLAATLRAWMAGTPIATGTLAHDAEGEARLPLPPLQPGAYRVTYETRDDFGAPYRTQAEFVVAGPAPAPPVAVPALLALQTSTVAAGGTARVLVTSGFPGQTLSCEVWRAGTRLLHRRLIAGKDAPIIELPIRGEDRGGLRITLTAVHDHQLLTQSADLDVPWDDRVLDVALSTFRDQIRPGAKETWRISVKAPPGVKAEAARAELLAYMYDRSLDLFGPHTPPAPMSLWPARDWAVAIQGSPGRAWSRSIPSDDWAVVPSGPLLNDDRLKSDLGRPIGGPGDESFGFGGLGLRGGAARIFMEAPVLDDLAVAGKMPKRSNMAALFNNKPNAAAPAALGIIGIGGAAPPAEIPLRSDFSETAFWLPHLLTGSDGTASIEFTVPDSVTSWNVWVHAVSKQLLSGSVHRETRSVKELMVRPNVPRFLREGDQAALKVTVNNASDKAFQGTVRLAVADAETEVDVAAELGLKPADLTQHFEAPPGGAATLTFAVTAPKRLRSLSLKATATAGHLSDGELRPLPILPSRMHLAQSRFVTLHDKDKRTLVFPDMAAADPSRIDDQLVVTVDGQLFTTVLQALPYLITYPYECTEQTLNRFLSSAIVSSVFRDFPAVARMAKELSARATPLEPFDAADPNRKLALEETPWLAEARGDPLETGSKSALVNVLDPKIAAIERAGALAKLSKAQLPSGAFPWFPGGPADPYMTLYIMSGFAKAAEFKVDVPKDVVQRGWDYLAAHFRELRAQKTMGDDSDCCWEWLTFLNYVASAYPDASWTNGALSADDRAAILTFSFKHWKEHAPYLKGLLALTLKRADRDQDAKLVWDSVMDSAKTTRDEGTFWAPEDRSWLWYNDTIETQAFALRTLMELAPADARKDGIAQWLLLNKKLNQWKSTRATAEVIYALMHYLKRDDALGVPELVKVTVGGKTTELAFAPEHYTGKKNQIVVPGPAVGPQTATVTVEKATRGFAFASATWQFSTEQAPAADRWDFFSVSRSYFRRENNGREFVLTPLTEGAPLHPGDELEVHLSLRAKHAAEYVHLRDPRGAGFEPENAVSQYQWDLGVPYYEEVRDSGTNFFFSELPTGEYPFTYRVRASMSGTFHVGPATVESVYAPEFNAYSAGAALTVGPAP